MSDIINLDYYPTIPREKIVAESKYMFSIKELSSLGGGFSVAAAEIAKTIMGIPASDKGLYRCFFPDGVTGKLASKDGANLGAIMNKGKIVGQARFVPTEGAAGAIAINPVVLAIAVAVMSINKKIESIQKAQEEILLFLQQDKESELEGAVNTLADTLEQYRFYSDNESWKVAKLSAVTLIKGKAESNIIFYRKRIASAFEKKKSFIYIRNDAKKLKEQLEHDFKYYQLSVYLAAYSSYLEVVLGGNYSDEYLKLMTNNIGNYESQYLIDYTQCAKQLEDYMKESTQAKVLSGLGNAGKALGKTIEKIPVVCKGSLDETLISVGDNLNEMESKYAESAMIDFKNNYNPGIQLFVDNIVTINEIANRPVDLMFDRENIYISA